MEFYEEILIHDIEGIAGRLQFILLFCRMEYHSCRDAEKTVGSVEKNFLV